MKKLNLLFQVSTVTSMLVAGLLTFAIAQNADDERTEKLTIDIEVTENGETTHISTEVDALDGQDVREIMEALDILDDIEISGTGERLEIKVKKEIDGDLDHDIDIKVVAPDTDFHWFGDAHHGKRPLLGVYIESFDENGQKGARVKGIVENSAAEKAGMEEGDVVTKVNGTDISNEKDLRETILTHEVGEKVTVKYLRGGKMRSQKVELGESENSYSYSFGPHGGRNFHFKGDCDGDMEKAMKECRKRLEDMDLDLDFDFDIDGDAGFLGVTPAHDAEEGKGVPLGKVIPGSSAEKMGLEPGDRILRMNGKTVSGFGELADVINDAKVGDSMEIEYQRDGKAQTATGSLGKRTHAPYRRHMRMMGRDCHVGVGHGEPDTEAVKEVRVVIELKDLTEEDRDMLAEPAAVDFEKELALNKIEFAPNPNDGQFKLEFDLPENTNTRVMVLDQAGRKVYEELLNNFDGRYSNRINISSQQNGVYFLIIAQGDRQFTKKIVKQ